MTRPILETDFLRLDLAHLRVRTGGSRVVTWAIEGSPIGSANVQSVDVPPGLILSFIVLDGPAEHSDVSRQHPEHHPDDPDVPGHHPERRAHRPDRPKEHLEVPRDHPELRLEDPVHPREHPIPTARNVCHRLGFRTAALTFGARSYFACPRCVRRARILFIPRRDPTATPRCRTCTGAVYSCDLHHRQHPASRRLRAMRLLDRARELLSRPRLRAERRARGLALLAMGETLMRNLLDDTAARGASVATSLEVRLADAKQRRSA